MSDFVLHALTVGGGILALCPLPGQGGDYAADLEHLKEWKPSLLISLTTDVEFVAAKVTSLGADMQDAGCRWVHLPIEDFGLPDGGFLEKWPEVSKAALAALSGGGRVLVHCKGGCGRSGMVVMRLMVAAGEKPDAALERLRHTRPCAIETDDQMVWARTGRVPKASEPRQL
ncbi:Dual specificity phosphatase, catalytic domain [Thalassovita autumnalis]|uniref:Dual specificity phosphatase, catalytic domain n=1 Tax=Thalassovita autumnalis TaxID=2072972 RepID=A0A0P1FYE5_9RHOB|nr:protein-tyrosine phosphatase family protein [Thalassovita autumnalis]CUH68594.1 Dual specificity phosphatase, catalytic domain [Thalassovita autumnalis]CUH74129.1 Dual specificity phosphatase, catalytic domain [Thalassovita autumnalis]